MVNGTRVQDQDGNRGTVVDTGCGGEVVHVEFSDGSVDTFERVRDGEFVNVDTDRVVRG